MDTQQLTNRLKQLKKNKDACISGEELDLLTKEMLCHIGVTDPILRDELIYPVFSQLIMNGDYTKEQLAVLLVVCLDESHLFYKVGGTKDDSVFTRSFSSLIIAVLLHKNLQTGFLNAKQLLTVKQALLTYLKEEKDIRGLVEDKGWAHSIAHAADAIGELVQQPGIESCYQEIYQAVVRVMGFSSGFYGLEEDERMALPVTAMLERGFSEESVLQEITFVTEELEANFAVGSQQLFIHRANIKQFLRSLYFRLVYKRSHSNLQEDIRRAIIQISRPYYS
ncbi:DUF2785 domain-containing protein [Sediminibacillus dalangtanensis]|uniref:DUF2785 domain-containing protein n=1 Tax=Sediminibacillus dalangtanensis TaxID=2729421 RepID=A0ABX7VX19_9BACI|nr:DUF2785 domain-containing protein [Sediminibacillus dalangtanensis]QTM98862.1 DUF2785 domain-containing protein [Sediminibacillus dalangtanensis]